MKINKTSLFKALIISTLILSSACEDKKTEISAKEHLDLAKSYLSQGSFKASLIEGKNVLQTEPNNIEALSTMATALLKLNDSSSATILIKRAIKFDNNNQNLKLLLVKSYLKQGETISSNEIFKSIDIKKVRNVSEYQKIHGDILFTSTKHKEAKEWYLKAIKSNENNIEAILGTAKASLLLRQDKEVSKYTDLAIKTSPNNIDALLWQAHIQILQKKHAAAESTLSKALIELDRYELLTANKYKAIDMMASTLIAQGRIEESFTYSNFIAQSRLGKTHKSYKDALDLFTKDGKLAEAEAAFQDILKSTPRHKSSGIILGMINYNKGDYTQAEDYLDKFASSENTPLRSKKILALTKIKLNKPDDAIEIITNTLKQYKNDPDLYALLGFAHLINKTPDKSITALKEAIKLSSNTSIYYINLSRAYLNNEQIPLAIKAAKKSLSLSPDSEQSKLILALAYYSQNSMKKARTIINRLLRVSPKNIKALSLSASIELKEKNSNKAKTLFLKILTIEPYNLFANINSIQFDVQEQKYDSAFDRIDLIISKYPENLPALKALVTLSKTSQSAEKSIRILNKTVIQHPLSINPRLVLARLYMDKKNIKKSLAVIDNIVRIDNKNTQAYLLKAQIELLNNKIETAKNTYLLLASLQPKSPVAYTKLASLYIKDKKHRQAIKYANKALAINNNFTPAHIVLFTTAIKTNNKAEALRTIKRVKKTHPNSYISFEMEADYHLTTKDYQSAIESLQIAWSKQKNVILANKLMLAYQRNNQNNFAFNAWDEISKSDKNNVNIQITYSLHLQNAKEYSKAKKVLEAQLHTHSNNAVLLNNLANLYLKTNDMKALDIAKKALAIAPSVPAIQDTVGWIYHKQYNNHKKAIPLLRSAYKATADDIIKQHLIAALTSAGKKTEIDLLTK